MHSGQQRGNDMEIAVFLQEHWYLVTLILGTVMLLGAVRNWNWLCDPAGKPNAHRWGRGSRRVMFFLLGTVLMVVSIWSLVLMG